MPSKKNNKISPAALTLVIMLKVPNAVAVKTRLARCIGEEEALNAYRKMVEYFLSRLPTEFPVEIYYTPAGAESQVCAWLGDQYNFYTQSNGDLGERLKSAWRESFERGAEALVLLGGDCPYIDRSVLEEVGKGLINHDFVIGPAFDGGYYLLAGKQFEPELFVDINWSTESVFRETLDRIKASGRSVTILKPLEDIDDLNSWRRAEAYMNQQMVIEKS